MNNQGDVEINQVTKKGDSEEHSNQKSVLSLSEIGMPEKFAKLVRLIESDGNHFILHSLKGFSTAIVKANSIRFPENHCDRFVIFVNSEGEEEILFDCLHWETVARVLYIDRIEDGPMLTCNVFGRKKNTSGEVELLIHGYDLMMSMHQRLGL